MHSHLFLNSYLIIIIFCYHDNVLPRDENVLVVSLMIIISQKDVYISIAKFVFLFFKFFFVTSSNYGLFIYFCRKRFQID